MLHVLVIGSCSLSLQAEFTINAATAPITKYDRNWYVSAMQSDIMIQRA